MNTFSPELRLHLGRVSSNDPGLTMDEMSLPRVEYDDEGYDGEIEETGEEEPLGIVTIHDGDVSANEGKWRIVPLAWAHGL